MKTLTLTQPFASLIAMGAKRIETRNWHTNYRGPLAIHAANGPGDVGSWNEIRKLCGIQPFFDALMPMVPNHNAYRDREAIFERLPIGVIVAVCTLSRLRPTSGPGGAWVTDISEQERAFGDYSPNRWGWSLIDVRMLPEPIPANGALGLWNWQPPEGWMLWPL